MQKLLIKSAIFLVGLIIILNLLGTFADYVAPPDNLFTYAERNYQTLLDRREEVQAISIGNSHSAAINFDELGVEGQVLTRAGADLFEVDRYIRSISGRLPALETVYISLSYYSFSRDNATMENMKPLRIQLYTMLPVWVPIEDNSNNMVLGKLQRIAHLMSVARPDHWHDVIRPEAGYANLVENLSDFDAPTEEQSEVVCSFLAEDEMESHALDIAGKNLNSTRTMAISHSGLQEDAREILAETIEYLQERDVEVVLYTPPYYEAYTTHFLADGSDIVAGMNQAIDQLQQDYDVQYYDFSADPDIHTELELFYNSDHVNECGGKVFTGRLLTAMQEDK